MEILLLYAKYLSKKYFDNLTAKRNTRPFTDKMRGKKTAKHCQKPAKPGI